MSAAGAAQTSTWTGAVGTSWDSPGNWSPPGVPSAANDVVVPLAPSYPSSYLLDPVCGSLTVQSGAQLSLTGGFDLTVFGDVDATGTLSTAAGSELVLAGTGVHTLSGTALVFEELIVEAGTYELMSPLQVTSLLEIDSGATFRALSPIIADGDVELGNATSQLDLASGGGIDVAGDWTSTGGSAVGASSVRFTGSGLLETLGSATVPAIELISGTRTVSVRGDVTGVVDVFPGATLALTSFSQFNAYAGIISLGTIDVPGGGFLGLGVGSFSLMDTGSVFRTVGGSGFPATVRTPNASGGYQLSIFGTLEAREFEYRNMGSGGIVVDTTATITDFADGLLTLPDDSGDPVLLTIERPEPAVYADLVFENPGALLDAKNVRCPGGAQIAFLPFGGALGGPDFQDDPQGKLQWGEVSVFSDQVELTIEDDPEFGVVYGSLKSAASGPTPSSGDGVFFAPTDLWKVTLRWRDFSGSPPTGDACDEPPADGLLHVRASDVQTKPVVTVGAAGPEPGAPAQMRARWTVQAGQFDSTFVDADLAAGFPLEGFEVELICECKDDTATVNAKVRLLEDAAPSQLSVYSIEVRTAAKLNSAPQNQILAVPWYFGVLLPNPLESEILGLSECLSDIRLSDPVHGKKIATHPGVMSMQWMAYYETDDAENDVLFWGTRDVGNHLKPYFVYPEPGGLGFGVRYLPENNLTATGQEDLNEDLEPDGITLPFDVVMVALKGDWYDAARYYRDWALDGDVEKYWVPDDLPGTPGSNFSSVVYDAEFLGTVSLPECEPPTELPKGIGMAKDYSQFANWTAEWDGFAQVFGLTSLVGRPWFWDDNSFDAAFGDWFPVRPEFLANQAASHPWAPYFHPLVVDPSVAAPLPGYLSEFYVVRDEYGVAHEASIDAFPKDQGCGPHAKDTYHQRVLCPAALVGPELTDTYPIDYSLYVLDELDAAGVDYAGLYLDEYHHIERACYDPAHGHTLGGGSYFTDGKEVLALEIKERMKDEVDEPFLWIESAAERYLLTVEIANLSYGGVFGASLEDSGFRRVPMFQAVYNEYQRFASVLPVNLPFSGPEDPWNMALSRHHLTRYAYESGEVPMGTVLSPLLLQENLLGKPHFGRAIDMLKNQAALLKTQTARDLLRFGQRMRDPVLAFELPNGTQSSGVFAGSAASPGAVGDPVRKGKKGESYPPVYASAAGLAGERVGILLLNWTAPEDFLAAKTLVATGVYGDQSVTMTIDPGEYGFAPGDPGELVLIDAATQTPLPLVWSGGPLQVQVPMPALSALLYTLERTP